MLTIAVTAAVIGALAGALVAFFAIDYRSFNSVEPGPAPRSALQLEQLREAFSKAIAENERTIKRKSPALDRYHEAHMKQGLQAVSIDSCAGKGARLSAIKASGIKSMWDLSKTTPAALDRVPGVGPTSAKLVFSELSRLKNRLRTTIPNPSASGLPEAAAAKQASDAARVSERQRDGLLGPAAKVRALAEQSKLFEQQTTGYRQWRSENRPAAQHFDLTADDEIARLTSEVHRALAENQIQAIPNLVSALETATDQHRSALLSTITEGQQAPPPRRSLVAAAAAMAMVAGSAGALAAQPDASMIAAEGDTQTEASVPSEPGRGEDATEITDGAPLKVAGTPVSSDVLDASAATLSRLTSIRRDSGPLTIELSYQLTSDSPTGCMSAEDELRVELALSVVLTDDKCDIVEGWWIDAETGELLSLEETVVLPVLDELELGESGADRWTAETVDRFVSEQSERRAFEVGSSSASADGFQPNTCRAALVIIETKQRWHLTVESAEIARLRDALSTCVPTQVDAPNTLVAVAPAEPPVIELIPRSTTTPPTTQATTSTQASTTSAAPTTAAPTTPEPTLPPTTTTTAPARRCDPNYTGCVPIDSDVDCSSGSGNGPSYAHGPIQVIGRDIYGLDHDKDGVACENG